jgi:hypothetical protein
MKSSKNPRDAGRKRTGQMRKVSIHGLSDAAARYLDDLAARGCRSSVLCALIEELAKNNNNGV